MDTIIRINKDDFVQACRDYPKYKALVFIIEQKIQLGELLDQEKLPAQRLLANTLGITHGTVTRAYDLLEKKGVVKTKIGSGTYINLPMMHRASLNNTALTEVAVSNEVKEYDFASSMQPMLGQQMLVQQALSELSQDMGAVSDVMTYSPQGMFKHKKVFKHWLAKKNIDVTIDDITFTQGAQQGIFTCLKILTKENDYILHEGLSYPGFFRAVEANRVKPLSIPLTSQGLDLAVLEHYCQEYKPKLLYITPNMQNPTNLRYSQEQLNKLITLSRQYDFYIVEDDVNYCLPEIWRVPLQQKEKDRIFYISSLSKYVAGGLRVAFTIVPKAWQKAFNTSIHSQCWMVSTLNIELACRFIERNDFQENQLLLADEMRYRQAAFKLFSDKNGLKLMAGGLNVWVTLAEHINVNHLNGYLIAQHIKVRLADLFCHQTLDSQYTHSFRCSLGGFNTRADFEEGLAVFERALIDFNQQQEVVI